MAYLTLLPLGADWMQWRVYDLAKKKDQGFTVFEASAHMGFAIKSFNQYAQSHRFWSPDGRYLVYANRKSGVEQVWLIDTLSTTNTDPILIDDGRFGTWSWN